MKIFLARHGHSEWNAERRVTGQLDPPLSDKGRQQARSLARALRAESLAAIYTSPLTRARETAVPTAVAHRLPIQTRDALKEMHAGVLQGRFRDARDPEAQRLWQERRWDKRPYRIPGGETFAELERRVLPCLAEILATARGPILLVGHRNTNRVILAALMGWPPERAMAFNPRSKYLYEVTRGAEPRIRTIHLDERKAGLIVEGFQT
jgi:broad specificity phosphatase PhoE